MQRIGRRLLTGQSVITLRTTRRQDGCVDTRQLLDLLRAAKNFVDGNESGTGYAEREQQH